MSAFPISKVTEFDAESALQSSKSSHLKLKTRVLGVTSVIVIRPVLESIVTPVSELVYSQFPMLFGFYVVF